MDEANLITCPYDKSHRILRGRMQVHLNRCRRNHKDVEKVVCPFDSTHWLDKDQIESHIIDCPERESFEHFKNKDGRAGVAPPTLHLDPIPNIPNGENWDDEPFVPSYDPQAYASKANVLRNISGAPPRVKKEFRAKERIRLLGIKP